MHNIAYVGHVCRLKHIELSHGYIHHILSTIRVTIENIHMVLVSRCLIIRHMILKEDLTG